MLQTLDLADLAEHTDTTYRPLPLATLDALEVSLLVAEGHASWFRQVNHDELLLVLEGVITLDGPNGKVTVQEGELATAPRNVRHHVQSGMRSTVVLVQELRAEAQAGGQPPAEAGLPGQLDTQPVATVVFTTATFDWLAVGTVGNYAAHATRLAGSSAAYRVPAGGAVAVVYRGVLDYTAADGSGVVVGSQMLVAAADDRLTLHAERGATVVVLAHRGAPLPRAAADRASAPPTARPDR